MPREMSRWKRKLLWLIFFVSFGFAGGGVVLLFGLVPLQRHLGARGWSQHEIDQTLSFFIFVWFLFALLVAALYSRFTLQVARPLAAVSLARKAGLPCAVTQPVYYLRPEQSRLQRTLAAIRLKPVRTLSGVTTVTVLTKPYPCPGTCIFCPDDVRMPKSYLPDEPGAMRALEHGCPPARKAIQV